MPKACLQIEDDLLLTWGITGWSNDSAIDSRDAFEGPGKARDRARGSRCQGKWTRKQMAPGDPVAIVTANHPLSISLETPVQETHRCQAKIRGMPGQGPGTMIARAESRGLAEPLTEPGLDAGCRGRGGSVDAKSGSEAIPEQSGFQDRAGGRWQKRPGMRQEKRWTQSLRGSRGRKVFRAQSERMTILNKSTSVRNAETASGPEESPAKT
ncbi:hypothetical protein OG21DRAFT_1607786 [Imleria badia]|nr:hypothetical protein OG21DRAFT_1607786 [Imleria badia]